MIIIDLAGVPVPKGRPRFSRKTGHVYSPQKTRSYEDAVKYAASQAMIGRPPFEGPCQIQVIASLPVPASWSKKKQAAARDQTLLHTKRPDVDNFMKCALDALNEVVFRDDSQVVKLVATKVYSDKPGLRIEIHEI